MAKKAEKKPAGDKPTPPRVPRLQQQFEKEIVPALAEKLGRTNRLALPRLQKIVISMGVGSAVTDKKPM